MKQGTKDLIGIIVPSLQLLLIGVLTALFTANLDKFRAGIDESEMINKLVMDLSKDSIKSNLKADFVLLSLERYLKKTHKGDLTQYDKDMLVGFAKSIIINRYNSNNIANAQKNEELRIPRDILLKYTTNTNEFLTEISKSDVIPSFKNDTSEVKNVYNEKPALQLSDANKKNLLNVLFPKSVYIQYHNSQQKDSIDLIRQEFAANNWNAPGIEYRRGNYNNSIRYFYQEDVNLVDEAFKILELHHYRNFKKILLPKYKDVPKGQIEIWINNK